MTYQNLTRLLKMITLLPGPEPHILVVKVPVDEWLCRKFEKLKLTVQEGYPSHTSETACLSRDQFVKPPKTLKWYGMHCKRRTSHVPRSTPGLANWPD